MNENLLERGYPSGGVREPSDGPSGADTPVEALLASALDHYDAGRLDAAERLCRQVRQREPERAEALHVHGLVAFRRGDFDAAVAAIADAIRRDPQARYYYNLGTVMAAHNRPAAAAECFRQALALQPDDADAYNNLGNALRTLKDCEGAVEALGTAIRLRPDHAQAYNNLANAMLDAGELEAALEGYRAAIALRPDLLEPHDNLLFALNYSAAAAPHVHFDAARRYGAQAAARAVPYRSWPTADGARPLRVGIVSGDLKHHPVGYFLESVLRATDRTRVVFVAYPTRDVEDDLAQRLRPLFAGWTSLAALSDEAAARRIRDDAIDILIDAAGHTIFNRLALFAWKPAPVQVSWIGYVATTGLDAIDYVLGDRHVLPADEEAHFVERPWRLPDSYLCYTPPRDAIVPGPLPQLAGGAVTFGYFGKLGKMSDAVVRVWSRVLAAVPRSRLLLKASELAGAYAVRRTRERFAQHGIDPARLLLEPNAPRGEYLASYRRVDVMLSPFPYSGGTTTADALWMGVPVLGIRGDRFVTHICESLLQTVGLADWVARDEDDYVAKAVAFATDPAQLQLLRTGLRMQLIASPLCNAPRFARHLEDAFHGMWARRADRAGDIARPLD
ncbi:tetratricopeptide repeat protein [Burkholderia diffusa]|uniref:O-linked N-acetylglucosamine transferase, SPINDLY family protein n=1 Tax=Burkholderia diffusa TaxID=488732 RepID=UPI002ABD1CDE|nr:tetratricopeptide repeat protein [Burkholderia diffusa]